MKKWKTTNKKCFFFRTEIVILFAHFEGLCWIPNVMQTKIGYLESPVGVNQAVWWFQVSMEFKLSVVKINHPVDQIKTERRDHSVI